MDRTTLIEQEYKSACIAAEHSDDGDRRRLELDRAWRARDRALADLDRFTPAEIMQMLIWYGSGANEIGPAEWVEAAYGADVHPSYRAEKIKRAESGFLAFYAGLDRENRARLIDAMTARYGADVRR